MSFELTVTDPYTGSVSGIDILGPVPIKAGSDNIVSARVSVLTTATALVAARTGRQRVLIKNIDTTNPIYVGPATVTAANGMEVKIGESVAFFTTAALQGIATGAPCAVCVIEEY